MHLWHGTSLCSPIVLLYVDVARVVARPRRKQVLVPQSLQVGRHLRRSGAGDEEIAAILEIEGFQSGLEQFFVHILTQHLVGRAVVGSLIRCEA